MRLDYSMDVRAWYFVSLCRDSYGQLIMTVYVRYEDVSECMVTGKLSFEINDTIVFVVKYLHGI